MIGSIRPMCNDNNLLVACYFGEPIGSRPHVAKTHFGYEIEVVFIDHNDSWLVLLERLHETLEGIFGQHYVKHRHRNTRCAKSRSGVERAQRGVWLHLTQLLCVEL